MKPKELADQIVWDIRQLEEKKAKLQMEIDGKHRDLNRVHTSCQHVWSDPVYDPIRHKGYHIEGDPPGTMGVDWRGPMDVPPREDPQWKRTCQRCGKVEHTSRSEPSTLRVPKF